MEDFFGVGKSDESIEQRLKALEQEIVLNAVMNKLLMQKMRVTCYLH